MHACKRMKKLLLDKQFSLCKQIIAGFNADETSSAFYDINVLSVQLSETNDRLEHNKLINRH